MKRAEIEMIRSLIAQNKCIGCCVVCENAECSLCGQDLACKNCKNHLCVNSNKYRCRFFFECELCKNIHCVNHVRFNPTEELVRYC